MDRIDGRTEVEKIFGKTPVFKLNFGNWEANRIYEVRIYDADMNLKYIIPEEEAKKRSWESFKKHSKWHNTVPHIKKKGG